MRGYQLYQSQDQQKKDELVREHLPLIYSTARRVANATDLGALEQSDLVQAGVLGLYKAMEKFDETKGVPFGAYAMHYVKGAMLDEVRKFKQVPRSLRDKHTKVKQAYDTLTQSLMRMPAESEVAEHLRIAESTLNDWLVDIGWTSIWSVEELEAAGTFTVEDTRYEVSPTDSMDLKESKHVLVQALKKLSPKEQKVLYAYYEEELTLKEIAYVMNLSESQISRIHSKAILRLRGMLSRKKADLVL